MVLDGRRLRILGPNEELDGCGLLEGSPVGLVMLEKVGVKPPLEELVQLVVLGKDKLFDFLLHFLGFLNPFFPSEKDVLVLQSLMNVLILDSQGVIVRPR